MNSTPKTEERIFCPKCLDPVKINLEVLTSNGLNATPRRTKLVDFDPLSCQNCNLEFTFIDCAYCHKKIYMKKHPKEDAAFNGLNGANIKCPYTSCNQFFYLTQCQKCKMVQKQQKYIKEGTIITCLNEKCKFQYIQVNCPYKFCTDLAIMEKPKNFTNNPIGIMKIHKKEIMYQKINCSYCWRPIVYPSEKNNKNKYCEGQRVECPYKDCQKIFNRIICIFCFEEIYINDGWYEMGSKIKCPKCKHSFGKILCPSCGKMNTCQLNFFKLGSFKCGFHNCNKENNMINCLYCRRLNVLDIKNQIGGQVIKCGYCKNTFNNILCPFCMKTNPFPLADFSFGKVYKCQYLTCMKEFQFLICPRCNICSYIKETQEGQKMKCENCKILFINWGCPFCKSNIMDENTSLQIGEMMIKCPYEKCQKEYSFIRCSGCHKLIFSNENESLFGKAVKCPYQSCKTYTIIIYCPLCKVKTIYSGKKTNFIEGDEISCGNCKKNYIFKNNKSLYNGNLKVLKHIEGKPIKFGVGEVDQNYLAIQDLIIYDKKKSLIFPSQLMLEQNTDQVAVNKNEDILKNISLGECIVCHNNLKESVFVPCGHRCVCYNCAVIVFAITKKCPRCNKEATCIIKKVYD